MKVLFIDAEDGRVIPNVVELPNKSIRAQLSKMYNLLECQTVDYWKVDYKGLKFDVWFDGDFLGGSKPLVGMLDENNFLQGNLIFAKADSEGEMVGLTKNEMLLALDWYQNVCMRQLNEYLQEKMAEYALAHG